MMMIEETTRSVPGASYTVFRTGLLERVSRMPLIDHRMAFRAWQRLQHCKRERGA
jgi:hypothetical protein